MECISKSSCWHLPLDKSRDETPHPTPKACLICQKHWNHIERLIYRDTYHQASPQQALKPNPLLQSSVPVCRLSTSSSSPKSFLSYSEYFARFRSSATKIHEIFDKPNKIHEFFIYTCALNNVIRELIFCWSAIIDYAINSLHCDFVKFGALYEMAGEGGTPATSNAAYYDNGNIPFIKIDDLKQKYLIEHKDFITELGLKKSSAWLIPTNSILYSNGATIGEISITTYPVCTKQGILGIVPMPNIDVEFLYYFMSSTYFRKAVGRIVTEGTMKTAYLKDINNILCPIPPKEIQNEIAKMPSTLSSKIDTEQKVMDNLCLQKQYLLRQMFI